MVKTRSTISTTLVLAIREGGVKRKKTSYPRGKGNENVGGSNPNPKKDNSDITPVSGPKEVVFFYYEEKQHWKHS